MRKAVLALAAVLLAAAPTLADMVIRVDDDVGSTNGGAFRITVKDDPIGIYGKDATFTTFCIETNEFLNLGGEYEVQLSDAAIYNNVPGNSDPLNAESAWLYTQWLDVLAHTQANADDVQNAIWYFEGEGGVNNTLAGQASVAVAGGWTNIDIKVMNLFDKGHVGEWDYRKQDLLVRIPAPAALALGALGLGLVGWLKKRIG